MKKILPLILLVPCIAMGASSHPNAVNKANITITGASRGMKAQAPITGIVKDETGAALPGVSVLIKGTTTGTQTDVNGKFALNANPGDVLVVSYVGYISRQIVVGTNTNFDITLAPNTKNLNEVVVTALGIRKSQASLSYDQQTVSGKELEVAKDPSFVNSLDGKVSGLQITQSSSGAGGSTKVVLRGSKSIYGSNNVLYVIDGVPLQALTSAQPNGIFSYAGDGGDGISNINPDDIESISVLKGASASALYGSQAANGVILITTKHGKAGQTSISFNSNTTFDKPVELPKFQNQYAAGDAGVSNGTSINSWGGAQTAGSPNYNPASFFNTGVTAINAFNLSTGTEKNQTYLSYANTNANGIMPGNTFAKNNITVRNTSKMLNDKLTLDVSASYIFQRTVDRPTSGTYFNALTSVYLFPRGKDFTPYDKDNYESVDPVRNVEVPNWILPYKGSGSGPDLQNPYWVQYKNPTNQYLNRLLATVSAKYEINSWSNIQARVNVDKVNQTSDQRLYAGTTELLADSTGGYSNTVFGHTQLYGDLLYNVNKDVSKDFNINGTLGASIQDNQNNSLGFSGRLGTVDNYFNVTNLDLSAGNPFTQTNNTESQVQSLFASVDFGYKKYLFLDVTARNDWASALSYTQSDSFFYPSVGLSDVLSSMLKLPDWISFSKIRASYTDVGNSIPSFVSTPAQYTLNKGFLSLNLTEPLGTLKPETTHSFEVGTEWRFINDHISLDATYYHTNTYNQLFNVATTVASGGFNTKYVNGGNVENEGFEGSLGYHGNITHDLTWNSNFTFSLNKNKVLALYTDNENGVQTVQTGFNFPNSNFGGYTLSANVGKPYGEIYAIDLIRDAKGNPVLTNGVPTAETPADGIGKDVGNSNPNFMLGWTNNFKYKQFDLAFTVDGRFGGTVLDMTQSTLDEFGVSAATGAARAASGGSAADLDLVEKYYQVKSTAIATYAYSATNIRLREASVGYTFSQALFHNSVSNLRIAFTGRNLFFFYLKAPFDPETSLATDNTLQGIDLFGQPSYRSLGFNVSARF